MDDLYERFADFLHEHPNSEEALRAYRNKKAIEAVRTKVRERRARAVADSLAWFADRRRKAAADELLDQDDD